MWREFAARRHLDFAFLPNGVNKDARLEVSRHDGWTAAAALKQSCAIEERNITVVQLVVVTRETALGQDRCNAGVEETHFALRSILSDGRHSEGEDDDACHRLIITASFRHRIDCRP